MTRKDNGTYELEPGEYSYSVSKEGYVTKTGSFTVDGADKTITASLEKEDPFASEIKFDITNTSNSTWGRVTVDWIGSGDDIATVKVEMKLDDVVKDTKTSSVSGPTASGTDELRDRGGRGETYVIIVTLYNTESEEIASDNKTIKL